MKQVYLDYSATTPVRPEVLDEMLPYFTENYGNASSLYDIGVTNKQAITKAREQVASFLNCNPREVFFTSGGTESDDWVLTGVTDALAKKGNHIITTQIEHPAVMNTCKYLEKKGIEVTRLGVDSEGFVDPKELEAAITDKTVLVSIMYVNNEVGTVQNIAELSKIAHDKGVLFHTDAVQALAVVDCDVQKLGVDFMSLSSHKIYGPKGIGALFIRKGARIANFMHGGEQESRHRAGTENVPAIVGFGKAAELAQNEFDERVAHLKDVRKYLVERILSEIDNTVLNGPADFDKRHPGNANITFKFIEGESILLLLNMNGIYISTGSACSSASLSASHVLTALGIPHEIIHGTVRFTVGSSTTKEDIDYVVDTLKPIVEKLREISPVTDEKGWL